MRLLVIWAALFASIVLVFVGGGHSSMFSDTAVVAEADASPASE